MNIDYEIIEKYISGELNSEELIDFNKKLENKDFKAEVELYKEINNSLANKYVNIDKENALIKTLENTGKDFFNKENKQEEKTAKVVSMKSYFLKISSIAAVLLIGFFLLKPQKDLYNQFAEHSNLEIQVKGENDNVLLDAAEKFNSNNYKEAIPLFSKYLKKNGDDTEIKMYLAISNLETNNTAKALSIFENIYKQNNVFKNKAAWYLALTYVKNKENSKAKEYLNTIPEKSYYYKNAQKLLRKL